MNDDTCPELEAWCAVYFGGTTARDSLVGDPAEHALTWEMLSDALDELKATPPRPGFRIHRGTPEELTARFVEACVEASPFPVHLFVSPIMPSGHAIEAAHGWTVTATVKALVESMIATEPGSA